MKTLAFVIYTVLSPGEFAGDEFITAHPVPCSENIALTMPMLEAAGWEVAARCEYTRAPVVSPRPKRRPSQ